METWLDNGKSLVSVTNPLSTNKFPIPREKENNWLRGTYLDRNK